jgi:hypothetical protein
MNPTQEIGDVCGILSKIFPIFIVREYYFSYMKSLGNSKFVIFPQGLLEFISYLMIYIAGKF